MLDKQFSTRVITDHRAGANFRRHSTSDFRLHGRQLMNGLTSGPSLRVWSNVRKTSLVLAATIAAFLFCLPLSAQLDTGRISGQITDQSGGAIAGATVTVIDVARGE